MTTVRLAKLLERLAKRRARDAELEARGVIVLRPRKRPPRPKDRRQH